MSLKERSYSVLIVSAAEKLNTALTGLLPESHYQPVRIVKSISTAKRAWNERSYDYVIINSPLPDDAGLRFAEDAANAESTVVLFLTRAELYDVTREKVAEQGIFTLAKPLTQPLLLLALDWMASARERLRRQEKQTLTFEEKMEEIRLVNRAKWLLISELKMDEPQAHHYIEKHAMDSGITKREAAEAIIRIYT